MTNQLKGLTTAEVKKLQHKYGKNEIAPEKKESFFERIIETLREPMFILLIVAASIYLVLGEKTDAFVLFFFVIGIIGIDVIQEWRTDKTLDALKDLSAPHITVIRNGKEVIIASADLVPGDVMIIHEGIKVPADGVVIEEHDLSIDESSLTGESEPVHKSVSQEAGTTKGPWRRDYCYAGTLVLQGSARVLVDKIGIETEHGKISKSVAAAPRERSPLQKQTRYLVKICAIIAAVLFLLVTIITWFNLSDRAIPDRIIESILAGIALAMAMIPEEFPVIMTVFLSLGAWRLAKKKSLVRKLPAVETLGEVSVLCVDKTGTLTMNQMTVQDTWIADGTAITLGKTLALACEVEAYDPMEKAMLSYCDSIGIDIKKLFSNELVKEYSFTNKSKIMGHVWRIGNRITVAAKGSPEKILKLCKLTDKERDAAELELFELSQQGLRVIAVATADYKTESDVPQRLSSVPLELCGFIGLTDPPRPAVKRDIATCHRAGIRVVMITGDNGVTASAIAKQIGMHDYENVITGDMIDKMSDKELRERIKHVSIFSRVVPDHKTRIVKAFKQNGEIVAMTGDGVNDAAALKYAHIGIAMGKRGSEVSREAADLILMDDNFTTIVNTVKDGRRIYDNIRKAVGYVFTIHIPIALIALLAPMLGIELTSLMLLPLHVVLLELVLDPTCSVVLERQPAEPDIMKRQPRSHNGRLVDARLLTKSVFQGLAIFAASFGIYYYMLLQDPANAPLARAMGLTVILFANLFIVQVNSSNTSSVFHTFKRLLRDKIMWAINIITIVGVIIILYTPLNDFMRLAPLSAAQFLLVFGLAAVSVLWYEIVKAILRSKKPQD